MIQYIFYSTSIWAIFLTIYFIFLRKEKYFIYNRLFLLLSFVSGIILPILPQLFIVKSHQFQKILEPVTINLKEITVYGNNAFANNTSIKPLLYIVLSIYLIVVILLLIKFIVSLISIRKYFRSGTVLTKQNYNITILDLPVVAFSFFNNIFIGKKTYDSPEKEKILMHETVHIRHLHTLDILLVEIVKIVLWFNPLIYIYKKYFIEVHEFEADNFVIKKYSKNNYSKLLIDQLQSGMHYGIANYFINSLIKTRIKMMYKKRSNRQWKYLSAIMAFIVIIFLANACNNSNVDKPSIINSEILQIADEMPRFPGCEEKTIKEEKEHCSQQKLMNYIYSNLKYPESARKNGIEGRVVVRFVVDKSGNVTDVNILRDIGGDCGAEVKRVVESMNTLPEKWIPGQQGGQNVDVYYTLPVVFKLSN